MSEDTRSYWGNFVTGEHDYREAPQTDEEVGPYLPQTPAALSLYKLYRMEWPEGNCTVLEAMRKVLLACVPAQT